MCSGAYTKVGIKEQQLQYIPAFDISSLYIVCAFEISWAIFLNWIEDNEINQSVHNSNYDL